MATYFVTFGQQYRHEPHLRFAGAHPDGWVEVHGASDELEAREWTVRALGSQWAFIYCDEELATVGRSLLSVGFDPALHPLGCLAVINGSGLRSG